MVHQAEHAGWFDGKMHILPVRVYYEDTDLSGIVYHANYLRYCERGRSDFLRLAGVRHLVMLQGEEPLVWTLRRVTLDYHRPAKIDDLLHVHTRYTELAGARMNGAQKVMRGGELLVEAHIEACVITMSGRPRRIPKEIVEKMTPFLSG
ncbi:MAG TPA: tol-pal system-associated acyl-CoA thioesterase [Alphaproteobacteria bacterium]|nr:tol-pal system-associated acyl-CoA thioesterase [Alphaproteobacteria bacterium]HAJ46915.1 tol-pal system-associated acyl-CoA thioesterase [Alphaproteobacteria bacterium]